MGIDNLLRFMKPYIQSVHIKKYAGKRVGIDAYSWLHKGAYSCSMELHLDMEGDKKFQYLKYFMHRIEMLRFHKITPVVVFDGGSIPCKAATEDDRNRRRKDNRDKAMEKLKEGDVDAASEIFQRAVSVTPLMARELIQVLKSENIEFVVAPYEADAQLAYLSGLEADKGGVVAVISEDSDLIAYGCPAIIFKMDRYGLGEEIVLDRVFDSEGTVPSFKNFNREMLIGMCVLAGCDFLPSVHGIGPAKAYNLVSKYRNLDRVISVLKSGKGKQQMPEGYPEAFKEAVAVFQHARVYDAVSKKLKHLKPLPLELSQSQDEQLDYLGPNLPPSLAIAIAEGNVDPCTMKAFDQFSKSRYNSHIHRPISAHSVYQPLPQDKIAEPTHQGLSSVVSRRIAKKITADSVYQSSQQDKITESTRQGLFSVVSRHRIAKKVTTGSDGWVNATEDIALQKLALSFKTKTSEENTEVSAKVTPHFPNNNPFKRQRLDEMHVIHDAVAVDDDLSSEVTIVEKPQVLCTTPESQQSVNSKLVNTCSNIRRKSVKLSTQGSNRSEPKRTSILNFFSPL